MALFERPYTRDPVRIRGRSPLAQWRDLSATTQLIVVNVAVFLAWQIWYGEAWLEDNFTCSASLVFRHGKVWTLLTAAFSHEAPLHIFVNMFCLWFAGRAVEARVGARQLYAIYLAAAVVSSLVSIVGYSIGGHPEQRELGASGAVMALLVMYACLYPRSIVLIWGILPMPAALMVILYIVLDIAGAIRVNPNDHVAHGAHLAGAAVGFVWWLRPWRYLASRREPPQTWLRDEGRLDEILDKVHREGLQSLTEEEREYLVRASAARRTRP
jgi:membrane associated rhomboid family serine protease